MEKRKKRFGDRRDGYKVRNVDGIHKFLWRLKPRRNDSEVYINRKIDVDALVKYVEKKKKENPDVRLTYFHAFSTAIAKTVYNRPLLNRFMIKGNYYDRNNVTLSFVAKTAFEDGAKENLTVVHALEEDNINTLSEKMRESVNKVRSNTNNSTDDIVDTLAKLPNWLFAFIVGILKFLDNHDWLPESVTGNSIYHSSILISNLGSIKCGAIYHNLTNFGTNSILITMGEIKDEPYINEKGKVEIHKFCEFGITLDERIADGFYYAQSVNLLEYIIKHPEMLEESVSEKVIQEENSK